MEKEWSPKASVVENSCQNYCYEYFKLKNKLQFLRTEQLEVTKHIKNIVIRGIPESTETEHKVLVQDVFADIGCPDIEVESLKIWPN